MVEPRTRPEFGCFIRTCWLNPSRGLVAPSIVGSEASRTWRTRRDCSLSCCLIRTIVASASGGKHNVTHGCHNSNSAPTPHRIVFWGVRAEGVIPSKIPSPSQNDWAKHAFLHNHWACVSWNPTVMHTQWMTHMIHLYQMGNKSQLRTQTVTTVGARYMELQSRQPILTREQFTSFSTATIAHW